MNVYQFCSRSLTKKMFVSKVLIVIVFAFVIISEAQIRGRNKDRNDREPNGSQNNNNRDRDRKDRKLNGGRNPNSRDR